MTQTTGIGNSGLLGHLSLCVLLKWSIQHGSFRRIKLLQDGLGLQKDGYQQNKRVRWELYHLLWLALKVIQCYFCCILLISSNDNPCSRAGELDFISWWREWQGMCGPVSRSPQTHGKPVTFQDSAQETSSLWGLWTIFPFHLTFSCLKLTICSIVLLLFLLLPYVCYLFVFILVYVYLTY